MPKRQMIAAEGKKNDHQKTKNGLHRSSVSGRMRSKKRRPVKSLFCGDFFRKSKSPGASKKVSRLFG